MMDRRSRFRDPRALTRGILAVASMLFAAWMLCARAGGKGWGDDFAYSRIFTSEMDGFKYLLCIGREIGSLSDIAGSVCWHYLLLNGRLANFLMMFYSLLPGWVGPLLQGVAYGFMMAGIMRLGLGRGWKRRPLALACMTVLVWCVFPWWDMHSSVDFMFNYVWSGAACLWSAAVLFTPSEQGRLRWLWLVIPAAMMHEGLSAVLDVGIVAYMVCNIRAYRSHPRRLVLPAAFGLFSLVPLLSPGIRAYASITSARELSLHFISYELTVQNWPVAAVFAAYCVYAVWRREWRALAVFAAMVLVSFGICLVAYMSGRALWSGYLLAAVMLCRMCVGLRFSPRLTGVCAVALAVCLCLWGVQLCRWQLRTSREREAVFAELRTGHAEGAYVFTPVTNYEELPWWLFQIPASVGAVAPEFRAYMYCEAYNELRGECRYGCIALMPEVSTLEESIDKIPLLPSGLRGDRHHIVTRERQTNCYFLLTFSQYPEPGAPGWHPLYSLRKFDGPVPCKSSCDEVGLRLENGDSVYMYRPMNIARSLWNHRLIDAEPCFE